MSQADQHPKYIFIDRADLVEGGKPIAVVDWMGRSLARLGEGEHHLGANVWIIFDLDGVPINDNAAKVWVELRPE